MEAHLPDDPVGNYSLPPSYKVENGDTSDVAQHNPPFEDIAQALSGRLSADGRKAWTGNQNANGFKVTGLSPGSAGGDAITVGQASTMGVPVGTVVDYAGNISPDGWVLCHGQAISRASLPDLFAVIGTTFGSGDGTTTFNVPDLRGRVIAGLDNMGGDSAARLSDVMTSIEAGASGGGATHTLIPAQIPEHSHGVGSLSASEGGAHGHAMWVRPAGAGTSGSSGGFMVEGGGNSYGPNAGAPSGANGNQIGSAENHTHSISGETAGVGAGEAHPNVQPTMVMNKIIKAR